MGAPRYSEIHIECSARIGSGVHLTVRAPGTEALWFHGSAACGADAADAFGIASGSSTSPTLAKVTACVGSGYRPLGVHWEGLSDGGGGGGRGLG